MPEITNDALYDLVNRHAKDRFEAGNLEDYEINRATGEPLYRYVGYRHNMPQAADAGRTIFRPLNDDTTNRWTGRGIADGTGRQGLYLSGEFISEGHPFPELEHYQQGEEPDKRIVYYDYNPHEEGEIAIAPKAQMEQAGNLRSMFLFSADAPMSGIDLKLYAGEDINPLIQEIYDAAFAENPDLFEGTTLEALYTHGEDASFCRAIGNACLEKTDKAYFETTSVRDEQSTNVILRGDQGAPLDVLKPEGRATFFTNEGGEVGKSVFTISDMLYNVTFDAGDFGDHIPDVNVFNDTLLDIGQRSIGQLTTEIDDMLKVEPPSDHMNTLVERVANLKEHLDAGNIKESITEIGNLSDYLETARGNEYEGFKESERTAVDVVADVTETLSSITDALRAEQERIDNPGDHPAGEPVDIEDPGHEAVDPVIDAPGL